jgi:hypothetical protein
MIQTSGFILDVEGNHKIVTAYHLIKDLNKEIVENKWFLVFFTLLEENLFDNLLSGS